MQVRSWSAEQGGRREKAIVNRDFNHLLASSPTVKGKSSHLLTLPVSRRFGLATGKTGLLPCGEHGAVLECSLVIHTY